MNKDKLMNPDKLQNLILFQRKYRFMKSELKNLNNRLAFLREIFHNIVNNYHFYNSIKFFDAITPDTTIMDDIKDALLHIPYRITLKDLQTANISEYSMRLYNLENLLIQCINNYAPNNLTDILTLLVGKDYNINYPVFEIINKLFIPFSVWDSQNHINNSFLSCESHKETKADISKGGAPNGGVSKGGVPKNVFEKLINGPSDDNVSTIIIGEMSLPSFLKSLTEHMIKESSNSNKSLRKYNFNYEEVKQLLGFKQFYLEKNSFATTIVEDINGLILYFRFNERIIVVQGIMKDDTFDIYKNSPYINERLKKIKQYFNYEVYNIPKNFKDNYINTLNIRDILLQNNELLQFNIRNKYYEYKSFRGKSLVNLINEFLLASKSRKLEILNTFLLGSNEDNMVAYILYDVLTIKDKKGIVEEIYNSLHYLNKEKLANAKIKLLDDEKNIIKLNSSDISYERRITMMNCNDDIKSKAVEKLKSLKSNFQGDNKAQSWLDGLLRIPFGIYKENSIMNFKKDFIDKINTIYPNSNVFSNNDIIECIKDNTELVDEWSQYTQQKNNYIANVRSSLDKAVYGHKEAKKQIERLFAQWINGETKGAVLGLHGPPGTGKTSLAKKGLSNCLIDDENIKRPFVFLPIGGSTNGSTLVGHNYTYVGSSWGRIVDSLMDCGCMNPIIFIDELDKISNTEYGKEIVSILTHLTDSTQNDHFEDKYFSGIPFDLSKALIVFSYNDISAIDPILRDRITNIDVSAYNINEKIIIIKQYMLPEIYKDMGFNDNEIVFSDDIIKYIINTFTNEAGVRKIKEKLVDIIREINLSMFTDNCAQYIVTKEYVEELFKNKQRIRIKKITDNPEIGLVNGLYASTTGIGGLTPIQVMKYPSDKMFDLTITGQQGDVMKESVNYAMKVAYSLLSNEEKEQLLEMSNNKKCFGLHVHAPDGATKKDGPSAGAAITLAIYSVLTNRPINNTIAMTGEIDLWKNVTIIGGVYAKLMGAKTAGIKRALIPKENMDDLNILRNEGVSPEDDTFEVLPVETIYDVIQYALL